MTAQIISLAQARKERAYARYTDVAEKWLAVGQHRPPACTGCSGGGCSKRLPTCTCADSKRTSSRCGKGDTQKEETNDVS